MSAKILLKDFGPIKNVEVEVKRLMLFIGPQTAGKSTIARAMYFFLSLRGELIEFIMGITDEQKFEKPTAQYAKTVLKQYLKYWGYRPLPPSMLISYYYSDGIFIKITPKEGGKFIDVELSSKINQFIKNLTIFARDFTNEFNAKTIKELSLPELQKYYSKRFELKEIIRKRVNSFLSINNEEIFIPAGRNILSLLPSSVIDQNNSNLDVTTIDFLNKIKVFRSRFQQSFQQLLGEVGDKNEDNEFSRITEIALLQMETILKGRYRNEDGEERIYFDGNNYSKLEYSSSGQQEILWVLLTIFLYLVEGQNVSITVEEPEAHLFPITQMEVVKFLALLLNRRENSLLLTTHSPYILAVLNNLILAAKTGKYRPDDVSPIIDKFFWLNIDELSVYKVIDGKLIDIIDKELGLIAVEELDEVSQNLNTAFDRMLEME